MNGKPHSNEFKLEVVRDILARGISVRTAAAERGLNKSLVGKWRTRFAAQAKRETTKAKGKANGASVVLPASSDAAPGTPFRYAKQGKRLPAEVKAQILQRIANGESIMQIERETGISNPLIYSWRKKAIAGGTMPTSSNGHTNGNGHALASKPSASISPNTLDAIKFLREAEREINRKLIRGTIKELSSEQLFTLLALKTLQGNA